MPRTSLSWKLRAACMGLVLAALPLPLQADSITTLFASDNGCDGNMFDIISVEPIEITSFDQNVWSSAPANTTVNVYYKEGTYVGSETTPGDWTLLGSTNVTGLGDDVPTPVPVGGLVIPANTTYAIYIHVAGGNNYTDGANVYTNGTVTLTTGVGLCGEFGSVNIPRTWNGTIYYDVQGAATSIVAIPTLSGVGLIALAVLLLAAALPLLRRRFSAR